MITRHSSFIALTILLFCGLLFCRKVQATSAVAISSFTTKSDLINIKKVNVSPSPLCSMLREYPKAPQEKLSFESGEISSICQPFVHRSRASLDMCGDAAVDPYSSKFTWPSRNEMYKRGNINIVTDTSPTARELYGHVMNKVAEVRRDTTQICCAGEPRCEAAMAKVNVQVCRPDASPDEPDACVYGGVFQVSPNDFTDARSRLKNVENAKSYLPISGNITLSSYLSSRSGISTLEPVIRHEFGHACSMVKMQLAAADGSVNARNWMSDVRLRCSKTAELPEAYYDFWESVGESREFAGCIFKLAKLNQAQTIDRPCSNICPGHYMEEAVGITFSLLTGDLSGRAGAVFPNTCNHIRDAQHPLVSDVMECLAQYSPRFRQRLGDTYSCSLPHSISL